MANKSLQSIRDMLDAIMRNPLVSVENKPRAGFIHARLFQSYADIGAMFDGMFGPRS